MPTYTSNYNLALPLVNNATDQDLWGGYLNTDISSIDTLLRQGICTSVQSSQTSNFSASSTISIRYLYPVNANSGAITATLPAAATAGNGATVIFQKTDSSTNSVTLARSSSDTINGATSYSMSNQYDVIAAISDGVSAWALMVKPPVAPIVYPTITGFLPSSIAGTSTTASLTISSGFCSNSTRTAGLSGAGFSWDVSNGNAANGYQGGSTLPSSSTIHFYVMATAVATTWEASFASTSLTPTLPGSYAIYRRILSLPTSGAGALLPGNSTETEGGAYLFYFTDAQHDVNASTPATGTLYTLTLPSGLKVKPIIHMDVEANSANVIATSPDETDVAPSGTLFDLGSSAYPSGNQAFLTTNTSGQIRLRATSGGAAGATHVWTRGWVDFRRS